MRWSVSTNNPIAKNWNSTAPPFEEDVDVHVHTTIVSKNPIIIYYDIIERSSYENYSYYV